MGRAWDEANRWGGGNGTGRNEGGAQGPLKVELECPHPSSSLLKLLASPTPRLGFWPLCHQSQHDGATCCGERAAQLTPLRGLRIWGVGNSLCSRITGSVCGQRM